MAFGRDTDGIAEDKWASASGANVSGPSTYSLTVTDGFPSSWSQSGGQALPRRLWNWFYRRIRLRVRDRRDQSTHGILHWNGTVAYRPSCVHGRLRQPYLREPSGLYEPRPHCLRIACIGNRLSTLRTGRLARRALRSQ